MAVVPEKPSSPADSSRTGPSPYRLMFVGPEGAAARDIVERQLRVMLGHSPPAAALADPGSLPPPIVMVAADTILEAVLLSGDKGEEAPETAGEHLILAGVSQELEHLESAVRNLRRMNPDSQIILLCEPADEVISRKAKTWGADDYYILPLDAASAQHILTCDVDSDALSAAPVAQSPDVAGALEPRLRHRTDAHQSDNQAALSHAHVTASGIGEPDPELPALPLIVQTELLDDLLAGHPDFAQRAVAALGRHIGLKGRLHFSPATQSPSGENAGHTGIQRAVALPDQPGFGTLLLDTDTITPTTPTTTAIVAQAANWLAGMLALSRRYEQLRSMAITDELSGAYNRRYFLKFMANLLDQAKGKRSRATLLLFDIDDFKKYNDQFGHASGDAIIRELIKLLRACTRPYDLVARIGGDEFAVVYRDNEAPRQPNSEHPKDVLVATERFREAIKNHHWPQTCNIKGEISISGGLATFPWDADSLESLMAKADQALLRAKAAGKNVFVMHAGTAAAIGTTNLAQDASPQP